MVAGTGNRALGGDGPHLPRGGCLVDEFRERNGGFDGPRSVIFCGRDKPLGVPRGIAPTGVMNPAAMVDGKLERGRVIAIGIEAERHAIMRCKIGIGWARSTVGVVTAAGALRALDGDVEILIVVGKLSKRGGRGDIFFGVAILGGAVGDGQECPSYGWVGELQVIGVGPQWFVEVAIEAWWLRRPATVCKFLRRWVFVWLCQPLFNSGALAPRIRLWQLAECEKKPLGGICVTELALGRGLGETYRGFGVKTGASGFKVIGKLGGASEAVVAGERGGGGDEGGGLLDGADVFGLRSGYAWIGRSGAGN